MKQIADMTEIREKCVHHFINYLTRCTNDSGNDGPQSPQNENHREMEKHTKKHYEEWLAFWRNQFNKFLTTFQQKKGTNWNCIKRNMSTKIYFFIGST